MMILQRFFITISIFYTILFIIPSKSVPLKSMLNIGTVLFTHADSRRECYSADEVALLTSRMMFQDLLPNEDQLQIKCDENILDLIEYFRIALSVVRCLTFGRTKHIILMAITDTLGNILKLLSCIIGTVITFFLCSSGGYMRHLVLPLAKNAYYGGLVKYSTIIKLYQLYDELKLYLRTDGQGWKSPRDDLRERDLEINSIAKNFQITTFACSVQYGRGRNIFSRTTTEIGSMQRTNLHERKS